MPRQEIGPPGIPHELLERFFGVVDQTLHLGIDSLIARDDGARRLWEVVDLLFAVLRGALRFRLALDPRGFDAIDDYDSREWLRLNGASPASIDSAFIRALYDLAFAYESGDTERPSIAAGSALRGALRAFFTYRGAFFWKMSTGMGDAVFAPLFEVLERRGVRFEFFHKLTRLGISRSTSEAPHVDALEFDLQARTRSDEGYRPLVPVRGLPCWPSQPDWTQLVDGERTRHEAWDLESQWDERRAGTRTLHVRDHFDFVVLGVGLGTIPYVCTELVERDRRWRDMIRRVASVPTQAFQVWLDRDLRDLGWTHGPTNLSGFVEPFDTWADMSHLAGEEAWSKTPRSIAYFCNVLRDSDRRPSCASPRGAETASTNASEFVRTQHEDVRRNAIRFLGNDLRHLWPSCRSESGAFRWEVLVPAGPERQRDDESAFDSQFWTANVRPSDRYTQALPGSSRYRISPLDRTYDNLTLAGDWTDCGLNMGCVEAAVMSGKLAAHAIAGFPHLSEIAGYDHP